MFDLRSSPLVRRLVLAAVVCNLASVIHGSQPAAEAPGKRGISEELPDYANDLESIVDPSMKFYNHEENDWNENEENGYFPEIKRNPYAFGLGKRNFGTSDRFVYPIMQLGKKEDPIYAFGLGKRNPYAFGLGKKNQYSFGLGKRNMYAFGLGKKRDPYAFGLGKRDPYSFGLGR